MVGMETLEYVAGFVYFAGSWIVAQVAGLAGITADQVPDWIKYPWIEGFRLIGTINP